MTKQYTIRVTDEGSMIKINRTNQGFKALELIGILESCKNSIYKQMDGELKPIQEIATCIEGPRYQVGQTVYLFNYNMTEFYRTTINSITQDRNGIKYGLIGDQVSDIVVFGDWFTADYDESVRRTTHNGNTAT